MPMDFFVQIRDQQLPLQITEPGKINCAAVLLAAQLIEADIPPLVMQAGRQPIQPPATIRAITRLGRKALDDFDNERKRRHQR